MKKLILCFILLLLMAFATQGQTLGSQTPEVPTKTYDAITATNLGASTLSFCRPFGAATVQVIGTFVGTLQPQAMLAGTNTFVNIQAFNLKTRAWVPTITTPDLFYLDLGGMDYYQLPCTAYTSGSITLWQHCVPSVAKAINPGSGGSGDIVGPSSSTDNAIARFDGTTGKLLQNSAVTIDDSGNIAGAGTINGATLPNSGSIASVNSTDGVIPYRSSSSGFSDSPLRRFDANTVEQRNSTNAQAFNVYKSYIDASNYSRVSLYVSGGGSSVLENQVLGSGVGGDFYIGNTTSHQVHFQTNNTGRWIIGTTGHLLTEADNVYTFGDATHRPSSIYVGTGASTFGGTITAGGGTRILSSGSIFAGSSFFGFGSSGSGRGYLYAPSDGVFRLSNDAETDFSRLQLGGTTSSFPSIKRNAAGIDIRLADDSGYASLSTGGITANGYISVPNGNGFFWSTRSQISSPADGDIKLSNAADNNFSLLQFGGTSNAFFSIKRVGTTAAFRTANDDADSPITASAATFSGNLIATADVAFTGSGKFIQLNNTGGIFWSSRSTIVSTSDGVIAFKNNAQNADSAITAGNGTFSGAVVANSSSGYGFSGSSQLGITAGGGSANAMVLTSGNKSSVWLFGDRSQLTSGFYFSWTDDATNAYNGNQDLFIGRAATAKMRFGNIDAASPVAQTISVQNVVAGTSNTAGTSFTIAGSQGTGTGAGGSLVFQVAPAGSSGTSQNALAAALTIDSTKQATFAGAASFNHVIGSGSTPSIAAGAGAGTSPTVSIQGTDTAGQITVTSGTLPSVSAVIVTATFATVFGAAPYVVLWPANANAATLGFLPYVSSTTSAFTVNAATVGLGGATQYIYNYHVIQ